MVLLVVDTQKSITNEKLYCFGTFINNVKKLIENARENNIEIVYIRHDDGDGSDMTKGTVGFEIYESFEPHDNEKIFDKDVNSAFKDTGLLEYLKEKDESELIIVGLQTEYCIDATIQCGFEHGFTIFIPAYANTTTDNSFMTGEKSYSYYNEYIWNRRYATCLSVDEMIEKMRK